MEPASRGAVKGVVVAGACGPTGPVPMELRGAAGFSGQPGEDCRRANDDCGDDDDYADSTLRQK